MAAVFLTIFGILLFNLIIFCHEFGHFFWAKKFGVKVNEFALGMGPRIFKIQKGETIFSLRAFPIGGFCEMEGEDEKSENPNAFENKKTWQKMIIIAFGAIMNLVLGFLMTFIIMAQSSKLPTTVISGFNENSLSDSYGLKEGDKIVKINGSPVFSYKDLYFNLMMAKTDKFTITIKRGDKTTTIKNIQFYQTQSKDDQRQIIVDFKLQSDDKNFLNLMKATFFDTLSTIKIVWESLVGIIRGTISFKNLSGPVGIASEISKSAGEGLKKSFGDACLNIFSLMTLITINLGIVNLLPLPALDGGRLLILLIELITRKKINPKHEAIIHTVGLFLFLGLILLITFFDVTKLFGK